MDIYCTRCGEPWDNDSIHDRVAELGFDMRDEWEYERRHDLTDLPFEEWATLPTYRSVKDDFVKRGCVALGGSPCEATGSQRAAVSAALFEILGDDVDGVMVEMEDAELMGLFDDE